MDYLYEYYNAEPDRARFLRSNNLAMAAEKFHAVGGFDPSFTRAAGGTGKAPIAFTQRGAGAVRAR